MAPGRIQGGRRALALLLRTVLVLLLLAQLGALWVIAHSSPTRLPPSVIGGVAELFAGRLDLECREATIDRRGRIRLGGVRIHDSLHPDDGVTCDIDILPDWPAFLRAQPTLIGLQARGRGSLGTGGAAAAVDDFVIRVGRDGSAASIQVAARAGTMVLRADANLAPEAEDDKQPDEPRAPGWDRELAIAGLRTLRSLDGAMRLSATRERAAAEACFVDNPAAIGSLPFRVGRGRLRVQWDGKVRGELALTDLRGAAMGAGRIWIALGDDRRLRILGEAIQLDGLDGVAASADGRWGASGGMTLQLRASRAQSRIAAQIDLGQGEPRAREIEARLAASELTAITPVAQAARDAGVDLCGAIDITDGEMRWTRGDLVYARGSFALSETGWRDMRPALVRPDSIRPVFAGDLSLDLEQGRLTLSRLDLAGIRGDVSCGLRSGEPFLIRLATSSGNPLNPSCLNSLLGDWWVELWSRFDLSTGGTRPHAVASVTGRWGAPESIQTEVRAQLERFGFMGARFLRTDLRVHATHSETWVRIDELRGDLAGADAGGARATVHWDWRRPEWGGQPEIEAEGNLSPACALRLHDAALATKVKAWTFGQPSIRMALGPRRPLHVTLEAPGESVLEGVKVEGLRLSVTQKDPASGQLLIDATGDLSGGKASLSLSGDLATRNELRLSVREWSRSGLERLVQQLGGPAAESSVGETSQLTVLYEGTYDFSTPWNTRGKGRASLSDPSLKTLHLMGGLSKGFDALGIGFSSYPLNRAEMAFKCQEGKANVSSLRIEGEDAEVKLKGAINLQNGDLDLNGQIYLKDSPWGFLKYINPNRLIAKMIKIRVGGNIGQPEVQANALDIDSDK